jgi:hypothetical protein
MTAPVMTLEARATRDSIVNAFALKYLVAFLLLAIAAIALAAAAANRLGSAGKGQLVFDTFFIAAFSLYVYLAQRTVYETGRGGAVVRTALLAASMLPIIVAIKFVLFVVTLHWVG